MNLTYQAVLRRNARRKGGKMDIVKILSDIKGKALDTVHFELLKKTYELQNQNITQLKNNNEALKESNALLQDKISTLEDEKSKMGKQIHQLQIENQDLKSIRSLESKEELSEHSASILKKCIKEGINEFVDTAIGKKLSLNQLECETAIGELRKKRFIVQAKACQERIGGFRYKFTQSGREYLSKNGNL